jgi:hypothetical protein
MPRAALVGHLTGKVPFTAPTNTYLALFTVEPTDAGDDGTEVSGGEYKRRKLTWGTPSEETGSAATSAETRFPEAGNATANWGTVVAVGMFDAATEGNLLCYGPLSASVTIKSGDNYKIPSGGLTLSLS